MSDTHPAVPYVGSVWSSWKGTEPANAEGIASEGGPAQAANPRGFRADAPSAEAGQVWEREVTEEFRWGQTMPAGTTVGPWKLVRAPHG